MQVTKSFRPRKLTGSRKSHKIVQITSLLTRNNSRVPCILVGNSKDQAVSEPEG